MYVSLQYLNTSLHESTFLLCTDGKLSLIKNILLLSFLMGIICFLPTRKKSSLSISLHVNLHSERNQTDQSSNLFHISLVQCTPKITTPKTICIALCQRSSWLKEFHFMPPYTQGRRWGSSFSFLFL